MSTSRIRRTALSVAMTLAFASATSLAIAAMPAGSPRSGADAPRPVAASPARRAAAVRPAATDAPVAEAVPGVRLQVTAAGVAVEAPVQAPAWQLRIAGPDGQVFEDTHLDGEPMLIAPGQLGYPRWLDGDYRFELSPVLGVRQRGDSEAAQAPKLERSVAVSAGTFQVRGGVVYVAGALAEPGAGDGAGVLPPRRRFTPKDVVTADDSIVQGSLCVGLDCVNNESFSFDTIRMRENNLRVKFDDTSTLAGYTTVDWQLTANDRTIGGANKFSIDDITNSTTPFTVTAGALTDSLFVGLNGKIGFRTSAPVLDLHMSTGDTPAVRFEQTGNGGFTPQTWDVAGNEANFFVRDVTGGSRLPLRIRPGAPTSSLDIAATGNVGIGTASPAAALHVSRASGTVGVRVARSAGTAATLVAWDMVNNVDTGRLTFSDDPAGLRVPMKIGRNAVDNLLRVGVATASTVDITGNLKVNGNIQVTGSVGPDYVFAPGFELPSIDEHAEAMWANRHLPKVGPAQVNEDGQGVIDLGTLSHGMLEELEYAHVYIERLDDTVQQLRTELAERDEQLRQMRGEIDQIKASLGDD